jgi:hypothetical protein
MYRESRILGQFLDLLILDIASRQVANCSSTPMEPVGFCSRRANSCKLFPSLLNRPILILPIILAPRTRVLFTFLGTAPQRTCRVTMYLVGFLFRFRKVNLIEKLLFGERAAIYSDSHLLVLTFRGKSAVATNLFF